MKSGPYAIAAQAYFDSGWSPIPLPPGEKHPPADDFTGANGKYVDELTLKRLLKGGKVSAGKLSWIASSGQIALRLPPTVLGIDADMYEGKAGAATLAAAIKAWGPLPDTFRTSSRRDGSGILLYRIPEGLAWPGKLPQGGGVELIRWDHRYAIVGPSVHDKTGLRYFWSYGPSLDEVDEFPDVDSVIELPSDWVDGLTSGKKWTERSAVDMDADDIRLWLSDRNGPELCSTMRATLTRYLRLVRQAGDDGGSHDAGRDGAWALIGDAHAGHSGVEQALIKLKKAFLPAVARRSDSRQAAEEWARIVVRGVQKVAAEGKAEPYDLCAMLRDSNSNGVSGQGGDRTGEGESPTTRAGSTHLSFARTDTGNAERLALAHRDEQIYVDNVGWYIWNAEEKRWALDKKGLVNRRAIAVARSITEEAEYLAEEDPKEYAELKKFARASENLGKLRAMVDICKDLSGMTESLSAFDADPARLGRVLLKSNPGVEITPALPEHRVTLRLGCEYVPGARSKEWEKFLHRVQPDPDVREWLQRLVGYSLYGSNRDRLFVANLGVSSTGKTTFMESLRSALGEYAAVVNMTVYRDNQDDKPRPDILRALRKRLVLSEETSPAWHLHADQVKRITGGAPLTARGMRSNEFSEIVPAFTPWIFVNNPPTIEGADEAILRRLVVVPWDVVIPKRSEDSALRERLMAGDNQKAVLAWALDGWTAYAGNPDLEAPLATIPARLRFLSELSDFDRALWDIAVIEEEAYCLPMQLYGVYKHWANLKGVRPESETKFGTFLTGRGYEKVRKRIDGKVTWVRAGIRISAEYEKLFSIS
jgi:putative DNA primase/helicase